MTRRILTIAAATLLAISTGGCGSEGCPEKLAPSDGTYDFSSIEDGPIASAQMTVSEGVYTVVYTMTDGAEITVVYVVQD